MAVAERKKASVLAPNFTGSVAPKTAVTPSLGNERPHRPTDSQRRWLCCGIDEPGGKLPLFDGEGQLVSERTVKSCVENGWAEPWFENPIRPGWLVCKLTKAGHEVVGGGR